MIDAVTVVGVEPISSTAYNVSIAATKVMVFIWLDLSDSLKNANRDLLFHFSDNGFAITQPFMSVQLSLYINSTKEKIQLNDLTVLSI